MLLSSTYNVNMRSLRSCIVYAASAIPSLSLWLFAMDSSNFAADCLRTVQSSMCRKHISHCYNANVHTTHTTHTHTEQGNNVEKLSVFMKRVAEGYTEKDTD